MDEWRKKLRSASFRGVPFWVTSHDCGGGRRTARHDFPQRDLPYLEDMGRKAREFQIQGFILGGDYFSDRDALMAALEDSGPGDLVHPFLGAFSVVCTGYRVQESFTDGRRATFQITFIETGAAAVPSAAADEASVATSAADGTETALSEDLADNLALDSDWIGKKALETISSAYDFAVDVVAGAADLYGSTIGAALDAFHSADLALAGLLGSASGLAANVTGTLGSLDKLIPSAQALAGFNMALNLAGFGSAVSPYGGFLPTLPTGSSREQQAADNQARLAAAIRRESLVLATRFAVDAEFSSYDEAAEARDRLTAALDAEIEAAGDDGDDSVLDSLEGLRAAAVALLRSKGANLARVVEYQVGATVMTSLQAAYDLYEDLDREQEIIERNPEIHHPGFLPNAEPLEVLSR